MRQYDVGKAGDSKAGKESYFDLLHMSDEHKKLKELVDKIAVNLLDVFKHFTVPKDADSPIFILHSEFLRLAMQPVPEISLLKKLSDNFSDKHPAPKKTMFSSPSMNEVQRLAESLRKFWVSPLGSSAVGKYYELIAVAFGYTAKEYSSIYEERTSLLKEKAEIQAEIQSLKRKGEGDLAEKESEVNGLKQELNDLQTQKNDAVEEIDALRREKNEDLAKKELEMTSLKKEVENLETQKKTLLGEIASAQKEKSTLIASNAAKDVKIRQLEDDVSLLQSEASASRSQTDDLSRGKLGSGKSDSDGTLTRPALKKVVQNGKSKNGKNYSAAEIVQKFTFLPEAHRQVIAKLSEFITQNKNSKQLSLFCDLLKAMVMNPLLPVEHLLASSIELAGMKQLLEKKTGARAVGNTLSSELWILSEIIELTRGTSLEDLEKHYQGYKAQLCNGKSGFDDKGANSRAWFILRNYGKSPNFPIRSLLQDLQTAIDDGSDPIALRDEFLAQSAANVLSQ